jgi:hypothetical protein
VTIVSKGAGFAGVKASRTASESLMDAVKSLSPEEQASVLEFIGYLKRQNAASGSPFLGAADRFIADHPELLRRLGQ